MATHSRTKYHRPSLYSSHMAAHRGVSNTEEAHHRQNGRSRRPRLTGGHRAQPCTRKHQHNEKKPTKTASGNGASRVTHIGSNERPRPCRGTANSRRERQDRLCKGAYRQELAQRRQLLVLPLEGDHLQIGYSDARVRVASSNDALCNQADGLRSAANAASALIGKCACRSWRCRGTCVSAHKGRVVQKHGIAISKRSFYTV